VTIVCPGFFRSGLLDTWHFTSSVEKREAERRMVITWWTSDRVARRVLWAVRRNRRYVVVGLQARVATLEAALRDSLATERGCDACGGTGLKGRQGVYEVMFMTPNLKKLVMQNADVQLIRDAAIDDGMLTLRMDGWLKVLKGVTTLEQVIRETSS
jgi:type IV pilus assembly protein PilB